MKPILYPVHLNLKGKLSLMAKPLGGEYLEAYTQDLKALQVDTLVSLLEPREQYELGLSQQALFCELCGIHYLNFPIPDRGLPSTTKALHFAKQVNEKIIAGDHVVIHCRAGIGRTGILASAALIIAGEKPQAAIKHISHARGMRIPDTEEQEAWLFNLPKNLSSLKDH